MILGLLLVMERVQADFVNSSVDYILLSSDSGRLSIIEFVVTPTPHFESLYQEVYGKTGSRCAVLSPRSS
jgi:hypothetical protein